MDFCERFGQFRKSINQSSINQFYPARLLPPASINLSVCHLYVDESSSSFLPGWTQQSECNWLSNDDLALFWQERTQPSSRSGTQTHSLCWGSISSQAAFGRGDAIDDATQARTIGVCLLLFFLQTHLIRINVIITFFYICPCNSPKMKK